MIRQKHADPDLNQQPPRLIPTDRRPTLFRGLRWEVFNPRTGETIARTRTRTMAQVLAYLWRMDYAPSGMGW